jgi:hypothetical protein
MNSMIWRMSLCAKSMVFMLLVGYVLPAKADHAPVHEIRVATLPPTNKSVINAMLLSAKVPLSVDDSCHGVGTSFLDTTPGEYLSGFLEELDDPEGRNYIRVEITADTQAAGNGWLARVWLGKSQGERCGVVASNFSFAHIMAPLTLQVIAASVQGDPKTEMVADRG